MWEKYNMSENTTCRKIQHIGKAHMATSGKKTHLFELLLRGHCRFDLNSKRIRCQRPDELCHHVMCHLLVVGVFRVTCVVVVVFGVTWSLSCSCTTVSVMSTTKVH